MTANGEATDAAATGETGKKSKSGAKLSEGEEEDDEDDNIDVVIGDIRTTPNYNANLHIKRQNLLTLTKVRPPIEDFLLEGMDVQFTTSNKCVL